jgi:hypothetical protein
VNYYFRECGVSERKPEWFQSAPYEDLEELSQTFTLVSGIDSLSIPPHTMVLEGDECYRAEIENTYKRGV